MDRIRTDGVELLASGAEDLGIHLSLEQLDRFRRYYEEMVDWNTRVNLTAITDWEKVQTRHFLDSLSVTQVVPQPVLEAGRIVDVGTGAGFPGMPLKIAFPGLRATLIDSTAKKTAFLQHLKEVLGLPDLDIRTGRAETLAHCTGLRERFDLAFGRALAELAVFAELTLPFCCVGGAAIAQKKLDIEDEIGRAQRAIEVLGGRLREVRPVTIKGLNEPRALVVLEKIAMTPERYPRRPGVPAKRPL